MVNEAFANAYLRDVDPLAAEMPVGMQRDNPYLRIIGVVGDLSEGSARQSAKPTVFYNQATMAEFAMTLLVRTDRPDATVAPAIAAIHRLDPNLPVTKVQMFESALVDSLARERLTAMVSSGFALSGLLLAALGVYGQLAFNNTKRTKEIAIRVALGAHVHAVMRSVVARGLGLVGLGAVVGLGAALVLLRPISALLFDVTPHDLPTYLTVIALLCVVAAVASYVPARQAARVEPLTVLRDE